MCGIISYCGEEEAEPILLASLKKLEYRGYDSVGIACPRHPGSSETEFALHKEVGKVQDLERLCEKHHLSGHSGIGHCRWATHGAVTWENAHPHLSSDRQVILVHNGIIENYLELRDFLQEKGLVFYSESDSEIIANLLAYLLQLGKGIALPEAPSPISYGDLAGEEGQDLALRALQSLQYWLKGSYALSIMFASRPNEIFAIRCDSPLIIGLGEKGNYFTSDVIPILEFTQDVVYLQNHQIGQIYHKNLPGLRLYNACGNPAEISVQKVKESLKISDRMGYSHFMAKEIHEQPRIFGELFCRHVDTQDWQLRFDFSIEQQQKLQKCCRIIFVGCGTSYHSCLYAKYMLEKYCRIPVSAEYASEFRYCSPVLNSGTMVVGLSQSGETADTLAALRLAQEQGAITLGLVNVPSSSIARMVDVLLCSHCNPEIGVASTKVYTAQLLIMYYLTFYLAKSWGYIPEDLLAAKLQDSQKLKVFAERILSKEEQLQELGRAYAGYQHMLYLGRGLYYPLALEGALKLKELSYIHAEGYAAAEMKHGPIALIDSHMPVVAVVPRYGVLYEKMQSNISEVKARGARVLGFVCEEEENIRLASYNDTFAVPQLSEELDALLYAIPLQLFAYYIARAKEIDPDQPRNLAKSVTVE